MYQIQPTVKKFCILRNIGTPAHNIMVHLHCGNDETLIDIDMCSMQPIQLGIRVDHMASSFRYPRNG